MSEFFHAEEKNIEMYTDRNNNPTMLKKIQCLNE